MPISLCLLGSFALHVGGRAVDLTPAAQKVLALIALSGRSVNRSRVAGTLWPGRSEDRALANLRGVLWRLPTGVRESVETRPTAVGLDAGWRIDVEAAVDAAARVRADGDWRLVDGRLFQRDLLPDWDSEWLVIPRERHRQLRLHALEDLARAQVAAGNALDAVDTAMSALAAEPLRESAQMLVLRAHLAAGNRATALDQFERFRAMLATELGVPPSDAMCRLVADTHVSPGDVAVTAHRRSFARGREDA